MIMMQVNQIAKSFAGNMLLNDVNIEVKTKDRIAIVGRNGAGKSTLLKIMTGETTYDSGSIFQAKDLQVGYLAQHNDLSSNQSIWDEMMTVFRTLIDEEKELIDLAAQIEKSSAEGAYNEKLINEYSNRQEKFEQNGGYRYKSDTTGVLAGLGFSSSEFTFHVNELSGGQKTRLALGKLLLQKPDILILDEPTNHLDIATLTWLENYLTNYTGAIIIVSHDRYFLDKIVNTVYEIAHQKAFKYFGTYTDFLKQKSLNYDRDIKMYEKQQKEIKKMEEFVERNIARASTTKRAQSRRRQLEKMEKLDRPLGDESNASFSFEVAKTSGNDVIQVENFSFMHAGEKAALFSGVTFTIHRGERIALIGENGIGKTTLLKEIIKNDSQEIKLGTNVQIGYYAQEQEKLTAANTILAEVWDDFPHKMEQEIRTVLGNFLFSGDDVLKHIHTLSGGEKARVALAKLMLQQANFLILDEPTNHLDLASKEVLESALLNFSGTIFFVSHDRYFINKMADKIFELAANGIKVYLGDYHYYIEKKTEQEEIKKLDNVEIKSDDTRKQMNLSFAEQKKLQSEQRKKDRQILTLETEIEKLEMELESVEEKMTKPENFNDHEKLLTLTNEANEMKGKLEELMDEWTVLQE